MPWVPLRDSPPPLDWMAVSASRFMLHAGLHVPYANRRFCTEFANRVISHDTKNSARCPSALLYMGGTEAQQVAPPCLLSCQRCVVPWSPLAQDVGCFSRVVAHGALVRAPGCSYEDSRVQDEGVHGVARFARPASSGARNLTCSSVQGTSEPKKPDNGIRPHRCNPHLDAIIDGLFLGPAHIAKPVQPRPPHAIPRAPNAVACVATAQRVATCPECSSAPAGQDLLEVHPVRAGQRAASANPSIRQVKEGVQWRPCA